MIQQIISSTDNKFLGYTFDDTLPIILGDFVFTPDNKLPLGGSSWRFYNSNYSIDSKEMPDGENNP